MRLHYMRKFLFMLLLSLTFSGFGQNSFYFKLPSGATDKDYIQHHIIFKVKSQYASSCSNNQVNIPALNQIFSKLGMNTLMKMFPNVKPPDRPYNSLGQAYADLSLIYELTYQTEGNIETFINDIY